MEMRSFYPVVLLEFLKYTIVSFYNNNNNNNNNIYLLQLGFCYLVAVIVLHVYKI